MGLRAEIVFLVVKHALHEAHLQKVVELREEAQEDS